MEKLHNAIAQLGTAQLARLYYALETNGFKAVAEGIADHAADLAEQEYVGEPAALETRPETPASIKTHTMTFSDPGLNLFRPPPMAQPEVTRADVEEALSHTATPVTPAGVDTGVGEPVPPQ